MKNYISNKDESVRMFESDFLEFFSRVHPAVPLFIYIPLIAFLLYNTINADLLNLAEIFFLFCSGIIIWTFVEYTLHRFLFHLKPV
ncbi:MAG: fatty acid hydroxylase, partial [Ignavibacteria bacterium]|nr:fatty acid hydroxylase [Ignavibacteria bacterium]